jgi:hypothetical protein
VGPQGELDLRDSGTLRRECLDFVIPLNESHLRLTVKKCQVHYNRGRPHSSLGSWLPGTDPGQRPVQQHQTQAATPTATTMNMVQFAGSAEVDPIFFESAYYVAREDRAEKPFTLFLAALKDTGEEAIAKIAMTIARAHCALGSCGGRSVLSHAVLHGRTPQV